MAKIDPNSLKSACPQPFMISTDQVGDAAGNPPVNRPPIHSFLASLSYYKSASDNFSTLDCRGCRVPLDVHQPDQNQPDQFLGTCSSCGKWFRLAPYGEAGLIVLELPELSQLDAVSPAGGGKD
jgi:hypothetical protein